MYSWIFKTKKMIEKKNVKFQSIQKFFLRFVSCQKSFWNTCLPELDVLGLLLATLGAVGFRKREKSNSKTLNLRVATQIDQVHFNLEGKHLNYAF